MTEAMIAFGKQYSEYLHDESRTVGNADSISFPRCEDDVRALLKDLSRRGTPITVQGGRTGLAAAAVPFGGHIMNMSRMNSVTGCRIDENSRFCFSLQPGVTLSEFRKMLEKQNFCTEGWDEASLEAYRAFLCAPKQFFTPDPTETSATIGGMVACNASGARSFLYGATRRHISGIRMLLADSRGIVLKRGQVFSRGRKLSIPIETGGVLSVSLPDYKMPDTKNASGYFVSDDMDALDLLIGSDGTLGVITQIDAALLPMPKIIWGVSCFFASENDAVAFVMQVRHTIPGLAALEFFDGDALKLLRTQKEQNLAFSKLLDIPKEAESCIFTELHCDDYEIAENRLFDLGEVLKQNGGSEDNTWVARTEADRVQMQFLRHAIPESANMLIDRRKQTCPVVRKLGTDMSVPDALLPEVMRLYRRDLSENRLQSAIWGHIGNNHLHVNILPRDENEFYRGKALYARWAAQISKMGGAVSAEHGVGKLKANLLTLMYGQRSVMQMEELKLCFDSKKLLGIGNIFAAQGGDGI